MKCIGYWIRVLDWGLIGGDGDFEIGVGVRGVDVRDVFFM